MALEREIKLRFADAAAARAAVITAGGVLKRPRRLQHDAVLDTADGRLRDARSVLRVRVEGDGAVLTFKGPVLASSMKTREELETNVSDAASLFALLDRLGFQVIFRYEKFREEFLLGACLAAIDETPVGAFVEIEGEERAIHDAAARLGRGKGDFVTDSYRSLYVARCEADGVAAGDMLFDGAARA